MLIRCFLIADAVAVGTGGKVFIHGGGISSVHASDLPWTQPNLAVYVQLEREDEKSGTDHKFMLRFVKPDGKPLGPETVTNFRLGPDGGIQTINVCGTFIGVTFPEEGIYLLEAMLDGNILGEVQLEVVKMKKSKDTEKSEENE